MRFSQSAVSRTAPLLSFGLNDVFTLPELSLQPFLLLPWDGRVAGGSLKLKRADCVDTSLFKQLELVEVTGGKRLSFVFCPASPFPARTESL